MGNGIFPITDKCSVYFSASGRADVRLYGWWQRRCDRVVRRMVLVAVIVSCGERQDHLEMRESDERSLEKGGGCNGMGPMTNYCRSSFTLFELSPLNKGVGREKVPVKHPSSADLFLSYRGPHTIYIHVLFPLSMLLEFVVV